MNHTLLHQQKLTSVKLVICYCGELEDRFSDKHIPSVPDSWKICSEWLHLRWLSGGIEEVLLQGWYQHVGSSQTPSTLARYDQTRQLWSEESHICTLWCDELKTNKQTNKQTNKKQQNYVANSIPTSLSILTIPVTSATPERTFSALKLP